MFQNRNRKIFLIGSLIALCFLWTSCGYLSWLYQLTDYFPESQIDLLTEVIGYLFQAIGLLGFGFYLKFKTEKKETTTLSLRSPFLIVILCDYLFMILSALAPSAVLSLVFGYIMNLLHGIIAAFYLSYLSYMIEWQYRALTFGIGYGVASIGSWLLSLPTKDNFLRNPYVLIVYGVLIVLTYILLFIPMQENDDKITFTKIDLNSVVYNEREFDTKFLWTALLTIFFLSIVRSIGFYFPTADISKGISLEFSRIFYAFGLILAGIISDKSRKYGALMCIISLSFPFAMIALAGELNTSIVLWILGYTFYGFYAVYRIVVFSDIASAKQELIYVAGFGLMVGRIGEAIGNYGGMALSNSHITLVITSTVGFAICITLFFFMYNNLYVEPRKRVLTEDERLEAFIQKYALSSREQHVFNLILAGNSNDEIAATLYISENTVKFHIRNILKKTECANRTALISLFHKFSGI